MTKSSPKFQLVHYDKFTENQLAKIFMEERDECSDFQSLPQLYPPHPSRNVRKVVGCRDLIISRVKDHLTLLSQSPNADLVAYLTLEVIGAGLELSKVVQTNKRILVYGHQPVTANI